MKKFALIIACLFAAFRLAAQDCTQYYYLQKNRVIEMSSYDEKGAFIGKGISKVSDVTTTNGVVTAIVVSESFDKNGKSQGKFSASYKCSGGVMMIDMNFNDSKKPGSASQKNNANFSLEEYPSGMKVGDHLKDAIMEMKEDLGNETIVATSKTTARMVVAKETVTTAAGTWSCLKITYKTITTVKGYNVPPQTIESTEWYVPNFGIVKSQMLGVTREVTSLR